MEGEAPEVVAGIAGANAPAAPQPDDAQFKEYDFDGEEGRWWDEYVARRKKLSLGPLQEDFGADICWCEVCTKRSRRDELFEIENLNERLNFPIGHPECIVPSGECPRCASCAYDIRVLRAAYAKR